jgi:hypothetical protein
MNNAADISVFSAENKLELIVEVKGNRGVGPEWASQFRHNLLAHHAIPRSQFFLLALPEQMYLWKNGSDVVETRGPDFVIDSSPIVSPYLAETTEHIANSTQTLQLVFASWLNLLTICSLSKDEVAPHEQWLLESGLYDAIKNGSVETDASSHECLH